jgi:hypothetical protein
VAGAAVALRRRDYRDHQREYAARGSMPSADEQPGPE